MKKVIIIAEAGVNHNGDLDIAKKLIDVAAKAGADYVKFQTFKSKDLVSKNAKKAKYQIDSTKDASDSQLELLKKLELTESAHFELNEYCSSRNIRFLSTGFDDKSLDFLNTIGMDFFKIPSGELTNLPYLRKVGKFGKPIVLSTGMATLQEVRDAYQVLIDAGIEKDKIIVLHCNTEYPTPVHDVNLYAMNTLKKELNTRVGYSDHTLGIEIPIAAVALGAEVIEKHFTIDRKLEGPDHGASLEPHELESMISAIRNVEISLGDGIKRPSKSETRNIKVIRKSIVAKRDIKKGEILTTENITVKRPGGGISPMEWDKIIGGFAKKDYAEDDLI